MLTRRNTKPLHRTRLSKTFQPVVPSIPFTAAAAGSNVTMTVQAGFTLNGIPQYTANGVLPTAAVAANGTSIHLVYPGAVTGNTFVALANDPAVRYANGSYLSALTVTL